MPCNSQLSGAEACQCDQERMSSLVVSFLGHLQACYTTGSLAELGASLGRSSSSSVIPIDEAQVLSELLQSCSYAAE